MQVTVKLYGLLRSHAPDYQPSRGIVIEIPEGATVKNLLDHLDISEIRGTVVIAGGRVLKANEKIQSGESVDVFQSIQGG